MVVREYRVELCVQNPGGGFQPVRVHDFKALDGRDARTAADVWVSGIVSVGAASHVLLAMGDMILFRRPLGRRVWEALA
jgi:hypothetical protein